MRRFVFFTILLLFPIFIFAQSNLNDTNITLPLSINVSSPQFKEQFEILKSINYSRNENDPKSVLLGHFLAKDQLFGFIYEQGKHKVSVSICPYKMDNNCSQQIVLSEWDSLNYFHSCAYIDTSLNITVTVYDDIYRTQINHFKWDGLNFVNVPEELFYFDDYFPILKLPLIINEASFDIYNSEDPLCSLPDSFIESRLLTSLDSWVQEKGKNSASKQLYRSYIPVGQIVLFDMKIIMYYRTFQTKNKANRTQLIACLVDKDGKVCSTIPISIIDTENNVYSMCRIDNNFVIKVDYYDTSEMNTVTKSEYYKVIGESFVKQ